MSTSEVGASAQPTPPPARGDSPGARGVRRLRGFADRWPFRRKLNVLVGVPLAVVAVLLTYLIAQQVDQARDADSAARLVRDSAQVAELVDRVETEHQQAILLSVRFEAAGPGTRPSAAEYRKAQAGVDAQVRKVRDTFGDRLPDTEAQALREINGLTSLRDTIEQSYLPADNIDPAYTNASKGLIDGLGLDHDEDLAGTFTGNQLDSLLRADAAHSAFETAVFSARTGDTNALIEFIGAVGSANEYTHQADRFARFATEAQANELGGIEHNSAQATIGRHYAELQIDPSNLQAGTPDRIREAFNEALASYPAYREQSQIRLEITRSLIGQIADRADAASSEAAWRAGVLLGIALFGFAGWIAFAVLVRRSVVRPVQALTGAARQVADVAGRELARVADDDAEDAAPPRLRKVPVTAKDEIGDLAEAFNHVQTTASALLERQVLSRRNVAEMFGNVGRRVSNLTTRQLALIDAVERGETDPALLERLYSIDHIAVRLRRNADSLMLLAGIRETVLDSGPLALTNVVRAALGQIEGFQRVRLRAATEVMVEPDIIGDLTLMVAELVENAVSFSPAGSPVEVTALDSAEGALVVVTDHGLGMSEERLAEENARLIRRERLDVVPTKVLGLFVVGTLARRWEVGVTLSRTPGGGVTAEVTIPSSLLLTMSPVTAAGAPQHTPARTRPAPAATPRAHPTAAGPAAGSVPAPDSVPAADSVPSRAGRPGVTDAQTSGARSAAPARTAPASPGTDDEPAPLPRRVPQRDTAPTGPKAGGRSSGTGPAPGAAPASGTPAGPDGSSAGPDPRPADAAFIPRARDGETTPATPGDASRPLRRRVRGATLRTTFGTDPDQQTARRSAPRPADAEAVRDALDEFEAAVQRAHRDSTRDGDGADGHGSGDRGPATPRRADPGTTAITPTPVPRASGPAPHPQHHHSPEGAEQ
ncbi:ATP-binding protein [Streptomyces sp. ALI-76-A]|uniref:ATP-binding protein n=1 Tax=Streptomyces sp. ALI-76-A TaxID=3025736 RepID=UPI00256EC931|nr:ATP-binding protein [Streptomyces sp. ALI-76-A]MDL5204433.1 HAMP domain-containing protein [Streptomyces sp. ALI-76-A]